MSRDAGTQDGSQQRSIGLVGATGIGVGAIVGGGILALTGVACATTGAGALLAFSLNGVIAIITALSFAEMATRFPVAGGSYAFARRVLSIEMAFGVGWIVWFASIVASVLYAAGFAAFALEMIESLMLANGRDVPAWLNGRIGTGLLAIGATLALAAVLTRRAGGGQWINILKIVAFGALIAGGLWALAHGPEGAARTGMTPLLPRGSLGLFEAMGFTFIALQGFDLIAAVGGEIREPRRNIPRAMLLSLGIALVIYLPLLFIIATVGTDEGRSVSEMGERYQEGIVAVAASNFLGPFGYWMVLCAGVLAMLSALQANLLAASRVALAMSRDRILPDVLHRTYGKQRAPVPALITTTAIVIIIGAALPDVAAAGAGASLVFLITFALVHSITIKTRQRVGKMPGAFNVPLFPVLPVLGAVSCVALATFGGVAEPAAGAVVLIWLGIGGIIFMSVFVRRARARDASAEALDPSLILQRGRSPIVLVPVGNPDNAATMLDVARAMTPPEVGRVLLLTVVTNTALDERVRTVDSLIREAVAGAPYGGRPPEILTTFASRAGSEIVRVANEYGCEGLLLGLHDTADEEAAERFQKSLREVNCSTAILRAPPGWRISSARRVLVPIGGRSEHHTLRARIIGSLLRTGERDLRYLHVLRSSDPPDRDRRAERSLRRVVAAEAWGRAESVVLRADAPATQVIEEAGSSDLLVLGLHTPARRNRALGPIVHRIANETSVPLILISS